MVIIKNNFLICFAIFYDLIESQQHPDIFLSTNMDLDIAKLKQQKLHMYNLNQFRYGPIP
jgi:hypothetical protein